MGQEPTFEGEDPPTISRFAWPKAINTTHQSEHHAALPGRKHIWDPQVGKKTLSQQTQAIHHYSSGPLISNYTLISKQHEPLYQTAKIMLITQNLVIIIPTIIDSYIYIYNNVLTMLRKQ